MERSSNVNEARVGMVLMMLKRSILKYALKLRFLASNTRAKYEELLVGLRTTL